MRASIVVIAAAASFLCSVTHASAQPCTPTGFVRDGINLTAKYINPAGPLPATIDATGCHIAIYVSSGSLNLSGRDIFGASYFGVAVNGDSTPVTVNLTGNLIHHIGENPFDGTQHGVGIYIRAFFAPIVSGQINGNLIYAYQKGGIVVNGRGARLSRINGNAVVGLGHVDFIAQNGIQIAYGAMSVAASEVVGNFVAANSYIGTDGSSSAGVLIVGGPIFSPCPQGECDYTTNQRIGLTTTNQVGTNLLLNNDVGVLSLNMDATGGAPPSPTVVVIYANGIGTDICYNQTYQAGISALGNTDYIYYNYIVPGEGYEPPCGLGIDLTGSINPQVVGNNVPATTAFPGVATGGQRAIRAVPVEP